MSNVVAIVTGTKLVYARNAIIPKMLLDYRATVVGREWRGKRRMITLFLPFVRVVCDIGGQLNVTFPEFKGVMTLACDSDPLEVWCLQNGKFRRII